MVDRETIQTAVYTLGLMTCINFIPYDGEVEDYLLIWPVEEPSGYVFFSILFEKGTVKGDIIG